MRFAQDDAVSPVIGTVLILGITVSGIVAVMLWGAPLIQDLQDRNAQGGMVAEFLEIRDVTAKLNGAQNARSIGINLPGGELSVRDGDQMLVTVNHDPINTACDMRITGWTDGDANLTIAGGSCGLPVVDCVGATVDPCFEVYRVEANALTRVTGSAYDSGTGVLTLASAIDVNEDYTLRLTDATGATVVEAWLFATDELIWERSSGESTRDVRYMWGAVLSSTNGAVFADGQPSINENAFRTGDYFLRLPVLDATEGSLSGTGSHSVFISLDSLTEDVDVSDAYLLRFDFSGTVAESLCNTLVLRNDLLTTNAYGACSNAAGIYSTLYTPPATPIGVDILHAEVDIRLVV